MKNKYLFLATIAIPLIVLDQATKLIIVRTMELHSSIPVIRNFFDIVHARNQGAAFGVLRDSSIRLPFLIGVSLFAAVVIVIIFCKLRPDQKLSAWGLSLVLSGALGNLIDRVRLGEVVDFLSVHWHGHYWPAFNVADSAICVGVGLLVFDMILEEKRKKGSL
ncbi:MAG: signal peptidase II [Deltaproteobacteria bacterium]|nr:signal peptidase II [Deltaproteobacteria bacterium]TLN00807.1 MAG: signal peptidase II [bacterium]